MTDEELKKEREVRKESGYTTIDVVIYSKLGLNLRLSGRIAEKCKEYENRIYIKTKFEDTNRPIREANGKSILEILSLGVAPGTKLQIKVEGEDEKAEKLTLLLYDIISGNFSEDRKPYPEHFNPW